MGTVRSDDGGARVDRKEIKRGGHWSERICSDSVLHASLRAMGVRTCSAGSVTMPELVSAESRRRSDLGDPTTA